MGRPSPACLQFNFSLEEIAERLNTQLTQKTSIRLAVEHLPALQAWVNSQRLTGRMFLDYSQGSPRFVTWEQTR